MISSYNGPSEMNEFELSAGVMGETLEMVECETVDLEVPARAEVVIEGHINKDVRRDEGPFGEFYGYNESGSGQHPVFEVSTVTHRDDPIFRHIQATRFTEHQKLGALMREGETYRIVGEAVNDLHDVAYPAWGTLFTGIIQLTPRYNGETRRALMAALSGGKPIPPNIVIAVDDDVDITSEEDILWSISTRCNPEEDVFVVDDTLGHPMQPALVERLSASAGGDWHRTGGMMGIDATKPPTVNEAKRDEFEVVSPMGEGSIRLEDVLDED
jgi:UbiD family decarboxylase